MSKKGSVELMIKDVIEIKGVVKKKVLLVK